jgi:ribosome-binding protein aMBF1 (putative translation factor)
MNQNFQDWEPVTIKNKNSDIKKEIQHIQGFKEYNKLITDDIPKLTKISLKYSHAIISGRNANKLTQKQLANKMCIQDSIIKDYENGKIVNFNITLFKKILRALNIDPKTIIC